MHNRFGRATAGPESGEDRPKSHSPDLERSFRSGLFDTNPPSRKRMQAAALLAVGALVLAGCRDSTTSDQPPLDRW
jgi:hypothetical protein